MDESTKVSSTLMEFGRSYRSILNAAQEEEADEGFDDEDGKASARDSTSASSAWDEETEMRITTLLQEVGGGAAGEPTANLSAKMVGNIVGMQSKEIQRVAMEYDVKKSNLVSALGCF